MLVDTGAIVALLDDDDDQHARCVDAAQRHPREGLLTTWPCFTEAMYLLGRSGGWRYQSGLWRLCHSRQLVLQSLTAADVNRMSQLMEKCRDTPMDLADASLVAVAESLGIKKVFTVDRDFRIYRLADGSALEVVP